MKHMDSLILIARDQPKVFGVKIASSLYRGNRLIAYGFNSLKSHPFQKRWAPHPEAIYTHAEIDAIRNALKRDEDLTRCTLYIARWTNEGQALAEPCDGCWSAIKAFGIRQVHWTIAKKGIGSYER